MAKEMTTTAKKNNFRDTIKDYILEQLTDGGLGDIYDMDKEILIRGGEFDAVIRVVVKKDRLEVELEEEEEEIEEVEEKEEE
jgi:hypothetical protein